jgi:hypothetical protein
VQLLYSAVFLSPLLLALVGPDCAVVAGYRLRVVIAVAVVPVGLVLLATLISAPTGWGHAKEPGSDDLTNTGGLVYLVVFTLVAELAGLVVAALTAGVSRFVRSRAVDANAP